MLPKITNITKLFEKNPGPDSESLENEALLALSDDDLADEMKRPGDFATVAFYPDLIEKLKQDHRVVLNTYKQVAKHAEDSDWDGVASALHEFRNELEEHMFDEAVRLYGFLHKNTQDKESKYLLREFYSGMDEIGRIVIGSLDGYADIATSQTSKDSFLADWKEIGVALGDRIRREEQTLYVLYPQNG